jgi:hypothetical protein
VPSDKPVGAQLALIQIRLVWPSMVVAVTSAHYIVRDDGTIRLWVWLLCLAAFVPLFVAVWRTHRLLARECRRAEADAQRRAPEL